MKDYIIAKDTSPGSVYDWNILARQDNGSFEFRCAVKSVSLDECKRMAAALYGPAPLPA